MARRNVVVPVLILINIAVFASWQFAGPDHFAWMAANFSVSWTGLKDGYWWTLVTSVFSHSWLLHFLVNMFVLNSFGSLLERVLGPSRFLRLYLAAGITASLSHCLVSAFVLGEPGLPAVGASGAIAGIILVFSLMFPREKILLFGLIPMPALVGALAFIGLDLWGLMAQAEGGGLPIGHGAHLGGAATGAFYYLVFVRPRWLRVRGGLRL